MLTEANVKKGDVIYDKSYDEYGVVNKVKGRVAYIKFQSTGAKSFDPVLVSDIKYKGKHKGKDLYVTEAICAGQSNRYNKVTEDKDIGHQDDEPNMLKSTALEIMEYGKKLMDKLDKYDDMEEEVDFPNWWQSKLIISKEYLQKAYHYLDSEEKTEESVNEGKKEDAAVEKAIIDMVDSMIKAGKRPGEITKHLKSQVPYKITTNAIRKLIKRPEIKPGEWLNESMIGIETKANFKPNSLKGALEKAGIKGFKMDRLTWSLSMLKLDKKDLEKAKKIIDALPKAKIKMVKESVTEATDLWKHFDAKMKLQDEIMDLEYDMKMITKDIRQLHRDMEQEAEPEGGKVATRYGRDIEKKEKEYKKKKAEFKKLMAKLDKMEQY